LKPETFCRQTDGWTLLVGDTDSLRRKCVNLKKLLAEICANCRLSTVF